MLEHKTKIKHGDLKVQHCSSPLVFSFSSQPANILLLWDLVENRLMAKVADLGRATTDKRMVTAL